MSYSDEFSVGPAKGFTVTSAAGCYVDGQSGRRILAIQNNGTVPLWLGYGAAPTASNALVIPAGNIYEPQHVPPDAVYLASSSSTTACAVVILAG